MIRKGLKVFRRPRLPWFFCTAVSFIIFISLGYKHIALYRSESERLNIPGQQLIFSLTLVNFPRWTAKPGLWLKQLYCPSDLSALHKLWRSNDVCISFLFYEAFFLKRKT